MTAPTLEYKKSMGQGDESWGKPLAFPEVTTFGELFDEWRWFTQAKEANERYKAIDGVTDYCDAIRVEGLEESLSVKANARVVEWINQHMIRSDYDDWYFQLVRRDDGLLVIVKNNQIIASRWLALLDAEMAADEIMGGAVF